jgi:hypothetical protein
MIRIIIDIAENVAKIRKIVGQPGESGALVQCKLRLS